MLNQNSHRRSRWSNNDNITMSLCYGWLQEQHTQEREDQRKELRQERAREGPPRKKQLHLNRPRGQRRSSTSKVELSIASGEKSERKIWTKVNCTNVQPLEFDQAFDIPVGEDVKAGMIDFTRITMNRTWFTRHKWAWGDRLSPHARARLETS